jgi:hypothetical protein
MDGNDRLDLALQKIVGDNDALTALHHEARQSSTNHHEEN